MAVLPPLGDGLPEFMPAHFSAASPPATRRCSWKPMSCRSAFAPAAAVL
jgi:hypothetical protein